MSAFPLAASLCLLPCDWAGLPLRFGQCIELIEVSCVTFDLCFLGHIGCFPFTNVAALFICIAVCQVVPLYRPHSHTTLVCHNIAGIVRLSIAPVLIFPWFTCHPAPLTGRIFIAANPEFAVLCIQVFYHFLLFLRGNRCKVPALCFASSFSFLPCQSIMENLVLMSVCWLSH